MMLSSHKGFVLLQPYWEKVNEKGGDPLQIDKAHY